jgi:hypothetical protein
MSSESKIEIKAGGTEFSATGAPEWVAKQLDKFFEKAASLAAIPPADDDTGGGGGANGGGSGGGQKSKTGIAGKPLALYLKEQDATTSQVKKFHSTAVWLHARGAKRISTAEVSAALKASNQTKLNNPADCLNQNVKKGLCEKDGNQFFVTD